MIINFETVGLLLLISFLFSIYTSIKLSLNEKKHQEDIQKIESLETKMPKGKNKKNISNRIYKKTLHKLDEWRHLLVSLFLFLN